MVNLKIVTFAVAGFAGLTSYDDFDRTINYATVPAVVISATETCRFEKREGPKVDAIAMRECAIARADTDAAQARGYRLAREFEVRFSYVSPVDGIGHSGRTSIWAPANAQPPREGESIEIRASKWRADRTRQL